MTSLEGKSLITPTPLQVPAVVELLRKATGAPKWVRTLLFSLCPNCEKVELTDLCAAKVR